VKVQTDDLPWNAFGASRGFIVWLCSAKFLGSEWKPFDQDLKLSTGSGPPANTLVASAISTAVPNSVATVAAATMLVVTAIFCKVKPAFKIVLPIHFDRTHRAFPNFKKLGQTRVITPVYRKFHPKCV
jgi:hypothetical protein